MFLRTSFQFNRSVPNSSAQGEDSTSILHTYKSNDDTIATILAANYFPANFGENEGFVTPGDIVFVKSTDAATLMEVLDTNPVTFGPDLLVGAINATFHAPLIIIAGEDVAPIDISGLTGLFIRGNDPIIGSAVIGGDDTMAMANGFGTASLGAIGAVVCNPTGFIGNLPEIALFNVYNPLVPSALVVDSNGTTSIVLRLSVNEIIEFTPNAGTTINGIIIATNGITWPISGNGATLSNFQETATFGVTWSGPWAIPKAGLINIIAINNMVMLTTRTITGSGASVAAPISAPAGTVPAYARPTEGKIVTGVVVDNSANVTGSMQIMPNGSIFIYPNTDFGNFTNAGTAGAYPFGIIYNRLN